MKKSENIGGLKKSNIRVVFLVVPFIVFGSFLLFPITLLAVYALPESVRNFMLFAVPIVGMSSLFGIMGFVIVRAHSDTRNVAKENLETLRNAAVLSDNINIPLRFYENFLFSRTLDTATFQFGI